MGLSQSKIYFISDTLKKDKLHQKQKGQEQYQQKQQESNDKEELVNKSDDERESSQEGPSITTMDDDVKTDLNGDKGSLVGVLDGEVGSSGTNFEDGPSETVSVVEEEKKDIQKKKSVLAKIRFLSVKKSKREMQPSDENDIPAEVKDSGDKTLPKMLIKKMKSLRLTKKSKSGKSSPDTSNPFAELVEPEKIDSVPDSSLVAAQVPDETIQDQAVTSTASSPVEDTQPEVQGDKEEGDGLTNIQEETENKEEPEKA